MSERREACLLALLASASVLGIAGALAAHAAQTVAEPVHDMADVRALLFVTVATFVGGFLLLAGTVRSKAPEGVWLRAIGVAVFVASMVASRSWVLPLFAVVALLAVPSLVPARKT